MQANLAKRQGGGKLDDQFGRHPLFCGSADTLELLKIL